MTDLRTAAQQALEALEGWDNYDRWVWPESALEQSKRNTTEALTALRAALAEPVQEPVAWMHTNAVGHAYFRKKPQDRVFNPQPLYTAPPQRNPHEFIGLDLKEMDEIIDGNMKITDSRLRDAVYAVVIDTVTTLMEKNSG